jgi:hypothetical protein
MFRFKALNYELCTFFMFFNTCGFVQIQWNSHFNSKKHQDNFFFITWGDLDAKVDDAPTTQEKYVFIQGVIFFFMDSILIIFNV